MTWLDFGGQRSKVSVIAGLSMWLWRYPHQCCGVKVRLLSFMHYLLATQRLLCVCQRMA